MTKEYSTPGPRALHPTFATSRSLARCSTLARLIFAGLIASADDQGRLNVDAADIRSLFRLDTESVEAVQAALDELVAGGLVLVYGVAGEPYQQLLAWWDYQGGQRRAYPSRYPAPPGWTDFAFGIPGRPALLKEAREQQVAASRGETPQNAAEHGDLPRNAARATGARASAVPVPMPVPMPVPVPVARRVPAGSDDPTAPVTDARGADVLDVVWAITGRYPPPVAQQILDEALALVGGNQAAVIAAMHQAWSHNDEPSTLAGRTKDVIRRELRQAEQKELADERAKVAAGHEPVKLRRAKPQPSDEKALAAYRARRAAESHRATTAQDLEEHDADDLDRQAASGEPDDVEVAVR